MIDQQTKTAVMEPATWGADIDWHEYHGSTRAPAPIPFLTVRPNGTFLLNRFALEALGKPDRLRIGYSVPRHAIALRASKEGERGSIRGKANSNAGALSGASLSSFLEQHNIVIPRTSRFPGQHLTPGILLFPLDQGEIVEKRRSHD